MATLSRDSDPKPVSNNNSVVFIDTNLDTHLAIIVSDHDTVSDLKKRILLEHPLCFPKIGQIQIHAIKVKRKGYFYHLSDSMLVKSAFHGFSKSWFLSVDASTPGKHGQNKQVCSAGSPNQVACLTNANNALIGPVDIAINDENEECPFVNPDASGHTRNEAGKNLVACLTSFGNNDTGFPLLGSIPETRDDCYVNHKLPSLRIECEVDGSSNGVKDDHNVCEEVSSISLASTKKRQKSKSKKEGTGQDNTSKGKIASDDNLLSFASEKVSSFNNFQVPQVENKQDEIKETPFVSPRVSEHTGKKLVNNLETGVKSSGNNDPGIPLPDSIPGTQDLHCVNHELPCSHVGREVDGSSKGVKNDCIEHENGTSISVPSAKKKQKGKRKKEETIQDDTSKENDVSNFEPGDDTVQQDIALVTNPSENADKEVIKESKVSKEHQHTECNNNNTTNGIVTESMKEASEALHASNKKHRKRKRSLTHDRQEMLNVETTFEKVEAQKSDEACKEKKELKDQFELNDDISRDNGEYKHNKVTEVASDIKTPSKKKRKGKVKSGYKSLSNKNLSVINDFNEDNVSRQFLEVQQKIKDSSANQSTEQLNDADPLRTNEHGGRRKGKKKSSNSHETPVVTSSGKVEAADHSSIQGSVQEETSEDGRFSKDVNVSKTTRENMEIGIDACKEGGPSKVKNTGDYGNHCDIDMKVHPSDGNEPKELTEQNVNFVLDHGHKSEAGQIEGSGGGRKLLPQNDPKPMILEDCTPTNQDIRGLNVISEVDVNEMAEPVKSEKKKRKKRKAKDSDGGPTLMEGIGPVDAHESEAIFVKSLKSTNCDPVSGNTEIVEKALNQTEGKIIQKEEMKCIVLPATDKEDDFRVDNASSMEWNKTKADNKKPSLSSDGTTDASLSSKKTKKNKSTSMKSTNKSSKTNLDPVTYSVGLEHSDSRFMSGSSGSSLFPSNTPKESYDLEDAAAKVSIRLPGQQDDNNLEAPLKTYEINTDQQILSQQLQHEANMADVPAVEMNGSDREDLDLMTVRNAHRREETKVRTHAESLRSSQPLSSKDERGVLKTRPDKKVPTVHETGRSAKLSSRSNSDISSIREDRKPQVNAFGKSVELKKRREGLPISNSVLKGSMELVQKKAGKGSWINVGQVVGKTQQKESLLAGAIFQDDSSGTSEDVDEVDKSDASTRTPSDNSLLSDFSDGDSSAGYGGKRLENGGRSSSKATMSTAKGMSIDHILRSSSRYKKAKITASQLEGTESQPDFVPDSLADI